MTTQASRSPVNLVRSGPAQYVNRAGILRQAGDYIAPWGDRALLSGGKRALAAAEELLGKSLDQCGIKWRRQLFTGESSSANIDRIKDEAGSFKANIVIGVGGGKSLDAAKQAAADLGLPAVCIPTIAATCAASTALSILHYDGGVFQRAVLHPRNPSLVLVDPEIIARSPGIYLRAGILDSLAKWYEGRSVWPCVKNPDMQTAAAFQLARVLYEGHRRYALEAVQLNAKCRVGNALLQTLDLVILTTGMVQSLSKGTLFTAIAHSLQNGLTLMEGSHRVLHGLKVGYGIVVQLGVEKCPRREFADVVSFFRQLGLVPSLKGLNLTFDRDAVLRVAEMAATNPEMGPLNYTVNKFVIASAMEKLEKRFG